MSGLYFRQLLSGRDYAVGDEVATAMRNFTYLVGDRESGEAVLVDPAYRPDELVELVSGDGLDLVGVIATHCHPDHVGGTLMAHQRVAGVAELLEIVEVPAHVQEAEVPWMVERAGVPRQALRPHGDGDVVSVGGVEVSLIATPGHTPGSQCLLVEGRLMSGDTLFIDGCGRTDLPGGDATEMYRSLHERLDVVDDETIVFPGHLYSAEASLAMGEVRERNVVLAPLTLDQWLASFGP
ncbi:MAG: fold metallo-hydrolase [Acidimicrobiaceae bacterium]|nr:fold metallo-hydrolase [Acidimicrobiaceae bacterium]